MTGLTARLGGCPNNDLVGRSVDVLPTCVFKALETLVLCFEGSLCVDLDIQEMGGECE